MGNKRKSLIKEQKLTFNLIKERFLKRIEKLGLNDQDIFIELRDFIKIIRIKDKDSWIEIKWGDSRIQKLLEFLGLEGIQKVKKVG